MKVLLISANTERINLPALPLGLALVGAAARAAGHDATFLNLMFEGDAESAVRRAVAASCPDVIGITPEDDLLWPRFYLAPGLGEWLPQAASGRPATS